MARMTEGSTEFHNNCQQSSLVISMFLISVEGVFEQQIPVHSFVRASQAKDVSWLAVS